jgi:hypothetical protein
MEEDGSDHAERGRINPWSSILSKRKAGGESEAVEKDPERPDCVGFTVQFRPSICSIDLDGH